MSKKVQPKQEKASKGSNASNVLFNQPNETSEDKSVSNTAPNIMVASAPQKIYSQSKPKSATKAVPKVISKTASKIVDTSKMTSKTSSKTNNSKNVSSKDNSSSKSKSVPLIEKNKIKNSKIVETTKKDVLMIPREHESYFVYLKNPLEYRRHLLESSRKILFCLKGYQKIAFIRRRKIEEMNKLRTSVKELIYLNKKFNELLPKYNMSVLSHNTEKKQDEIKAKNIAPAPTTRRPQAPKEKTEIEKLEESLANIESKLRTLQ